MIESVWVEPYPDERLGVPDGYASPEALRCASVELAFIVALQTLPGTQRRADPADVLGFSARRPPTRSTRRWRRPTALRRARKTLARTVPAESQQANLRTLGDDGLREVVERYIDAWERGDVGAILALLAEDATFTMPPLPTWYRGHAAIAVPGPLRTRRPLAPRRDPGQRPGRVR